MSFFKNRTVIGVICIILSLVICFAVTPLPHSPELARQTLSGNLLADLSLRDSRGFRKELEAVSREVFGC